MGNGTFRYMCIQIATLNELYEQQSTHLTQNETQMNMQMHMEYKCIHENRYNICSTTTVYVSVMSTKIVNR